MPKETPQMRAPRPTERIRGVLQSAYEALAKQPLARIADLTGISDFSGTARSFTDPNSSVKRGEMPGGPGKNAFKLSKHAIMPDEFNFNEMKMVDDAPYGINASGESMASQEAMNRMQSMMNQGKKYQVRRGNTKRDLIGPEAVDYTPRSGEDYGILDADGFFQLLQRGR
jgi:hypothetical protein